MDLGVRLGVDPARPDRPQRRPLPEAVLHGEADGDGADDQPRLDVEPTPPRPLGGEGEQCDADGVHQEDERDREDDDQDERERHP
ncbi:MAG: hypothetical protein V5A62_04490 [Haloarculaceae archaeon]